MLIKNEFEIGETVYLITDKEQQPRIVIGIKVFKLGEIMYELVSGTIQSSHYPFEMSREVSVLMTTTN